MKTTLTLVLVVVSILTLAVASGRTYEPGRELLIVSAVPVTSGSTVHLLNTSPELNRIVLEAFTDDDARVRKILAWGEFKRFHGYGFLVSELFPRFKANEFRGTLWIYGTGAYQVVVDGVRAAPVVMKPEHYSFQVVRVYDTW